MQSIGTHPALRQLQLERLHHGHAYPESRVLIIITGGTICMMPSEHGLVPARGFLKTGLAPSPTFNDGSYPDPLEIVARHNSGTRLSYQSPAFTKPVQSLRTPPSRYGRQVRYCVYEFDNLLDSSNIDGRGWDYIAQAVADNYGRFDGFVILHGTDSLAYTASALSFMLQNLGKPVVLTGSQAPVWQLQTDAADNLLGALVVAGHFMIPEVCLFFNQALLRGNRSTKVSAEAFAAFASPNLPPLATVSGMRTRVNWDIACRPVASPFSVRYGLDTSCVACIRVFPGIQPAMVDSILRTPGLRGLVLESFGAGNIPDGSKEDPDGKRSPSLSEILAAAVERGIIVVNVSQCLTGSVTALYAPGMALHRAGVVLGKDMTTEAALTKLAYLLTFTEDVVGPESELSLDNQAISRRMSVNLRGELSEMGTTRFAHPLIGEPLSSDITPPGEETDKTGSGVFESSSDSPSQPNANASPLAILPPPRSLPVADSHLGSSSSPPPTSLVAADGGHNVAGTALTPDQTTLATLSYAIKAVDLPLVAEVLARHPHPRRLLSEADYAGNTPLHIAASVLSDDSTSPKEHSHAPPPAMSASNGHLSHSSKSSHILTFLLKHGASVHIRNCAGHTPLFSAARSGHVEFVRILKSSGAHLHPAEMMAARALALAAMTIEKELEEKLKAYKHSAAETDTSGRGVADGDGAGDEAAGGESRVVSVVEKDAREDGTGEAAALAEVSLENARRRICAWKEAGVELDEGATMTM